MTIELIEEPIPWDYIDPKDDFWLPRISIEEAEWIELQKKLAEKAETKIKRVTRDTEIRTSKSQKIKVIIDKLKSGKVGYGTGYRYHDSLKPEIDKFIDIIVSQLDLFPEQISYTINQPAKRKRFQLAEHIKEKDLHDVYLETEELRTIIESRHFDAGYHTLWDLMDDLKELNEESRNHSTIDMRTGYEVCLDDLGKLNAPTPDNSDGILDDIENEDYDDEFYPQSDKFPTKSYIAEWMKILVEDLRKNHKYLVHNMHYEDVCLGVVRFILDQDKLDRDVDVVGYVKKLWGEERYQEHLRHVYMVYNRATEIYSLKNAESEIKC